MTRGPRKRTGRSETHTILDEQKRLSECAVWSMLEDLYASGSLSTWDRVPSYLTSNSFIAEVYADLILSFLKDYESRLDFENPLYIIEMGAGTGTFSFYLLKELQAKRRHFSSFSRLKIRYLLTDFSLRIVHECFRHPKLRPFVEDGTLDFACFRPEHENRINPWLEKTELCASTINNPVITIANYLFDSMRQDAFRVENGQLQEIRHTFSYDFRKARAKDRVPFKALEKTETAVNVATDYYQDSLLNALISSYRVFKSKTILFPIGAFSCLQNLFRLTDGNFALLSSDKGFTSLESMEGIRPIPFTAHDGVFSYMVNYHALAGFFETLSGTAFLTTDQTTPLASMMGVCLRNRISLGHTSCTFHQRMTSQNAINSLYICQNFFENRASGNRKTKQDLESCIAFVRLCNFDPVAFCKCAEKIYLGLEGVTDLQKASLVELLEKVGDNFYSVQQDCDVFYWIGKIYFGLDMPDSALAMFHQSIRLFGPSNANLYYTAVCHELMANYRRALHYYRRSIAIEPDCSSSRKGVRRVKQELSRKKCRSENRH
jgi:tetratricopeptide (TPR) repeat protein